MEIRPPAPGAFMPILPASGQDMLIIQGGSARLMKLISSAAFPTMNIQPVLKYMQQDMLQPLIPIRSKPMCSTLSWHLLTGQAAPNFQENRQNSYTRVFSRKFVIIQGLTHKE